MKLKAMFGGKLELWRWSLRRGELRQLGFMALLVLALLALRESEMYDARTEIEGLRQEVNSYRRTAGFADLPPKMFLLSASSPKELEDRMREFSAWLDIKRGALFMERTKK